MEGITSPSFFFVLPPDRRIGRLHGGAPGQIKHLTYEGSIANKNHLRFLERKKEEQ
jgi:hypothetical protein